MMQHMNGAPGDLRKLLEYLEANPWDAAFVLWILKTDETPLYAILPSGPFAQYAYDRLRQFLREQLYEGVERLSIGGYVFGSTPLMTGEIVPHLVPEPRCMYDWTTAKLVETACGKQPPDSASNKDREKFQQKVQAVRSLLERMYHDLRGLGTDPRDKARIYAATNALNASTIFEDALSDGMQLDMIDAEPSPIGREGFEYWDVRMVFFDPRRQFERARRGVSFCCRSEPRLSGYGRANTILGGVTGH